MDLTQQMLMVFVVLMVLVVFLALLQHKGLARFHLARRRGSPSRMELLDRIPLSPHHSLHLVRVADRVILVSTSPYGCSLLESSMAGGDFSTAGE